MRVAVLVPPRADNIRADQEDTYVQAGEVTACLRKLGHEPLPAEYADHGERTAAVIAQLKPDVVVNLVEEVPEGSDQVHLATALFDRLGVRYTGSRTDCIAALGDKRAMKAALRAAGLPTCPGPEEAPEGTRFIVKSAREHASLGLDRHSVVTGAGAAHALMDKKRAEFGGDWFAEAYIDGREFDLALLETANGPVVFPPAEIEFVGYEDGRPKVYNFEGKWVEHTVDFDSTPRVFPAREEPLFSELERIAIACWHLFGLRGFSHIEFRVDGKTGKPYVLEVNANPCLTAEAGFCMSGAEAGYSQTDIVAALLAAT